MLHCPTPLRLPPYSSLKHLDGQGNYAVAKYYKFPYSFFYRKKLKMIVDLMEKDKVYHNILDFGAGSGIFTEELKRHAIFVKGIDVNDAIDRRWHYDAIVCASVLEFVPLYSTLVQLKLFLNPGGHIFIASPMQNFITDSYFKMIDDKNKRHSHSEILSVVSKHFRIERYNTWMNLYFALRATKI